MSQIIGEMILFRPSVKVYTFAARHEELQYCKGLDVMPDGFYLLLARTGLALRYRHASKRVSQRSLSCEIVSNPPFVAFRYSEDLYSGELTGRVMLGVPGGEMAVCGIVGDHFREA